MLEDLGGFRDLELVLTRAGLILTFALGLSARRAPAARRLAS
jgi:hypothetical protein